MLLYHPDSNQPVDCHESQVDNMKRRGWVENPPDQGNESKPQTEGKQDGNA